MNPDKLYRIQIIVGQGQQLNLEKVYNGTHPDEWDQLKRDIGDLSRDFSGMIRVLSWNKPNVLSHDMLEVPIPSHAK